MTEFEPAASRPDDAAIATALRAFAGGFCEGAAPALTTVLNRSVRMAVAGVEALSHADLLARVPLPWVVVKVPYARGLSGVHALVFPLPAALDLARAAVGDRAGAEATLTPASEDALKEMVTEMLTAAAGTLAPVVRRAVSFGSVTLWLAEDAAALPPELAEPTERSWVIQATASGDDGFQADLVLTVGEALAADIAGGAEIFEGAAASAPAAGSTATGAAARLDLILDISLPITVELGRARMQIQDILKLGPGSIVELEKSAGDPVDLYVNDRPIAKGEVVVIDENFGVRLTSIVTASERIRTLR